MRTYNLTRGGVQYLALPLESIVALLGETEAKTFLLENAIDRVKRAAHRELYKYDWYAARDYRLKDTANPDPIPVAIEQHYNAVTAWSDAAEGALANMTMEQLDAYVPQPPTLG